MDKKRFIIPDCSFSENELLESLLSASNEDFIIDDDDPGFNY